MIIRIFIIFLGSDIVSNLSKYNQAENRRLMRGFFSKLKDLTGYTLNDIARVFGVTKQAIDQGADNYGHTSLCANKYKLLVMANLKIDEYQRKIKELEDFKNEINDLKIEQVKNE